MEGIFYSIRSSIETDTNLKKILIDFYLLSFNVLHGKKNKYFGWISNFWDTSVAAICMPFLVCYLAALYLLYACVVSINIE